MGRYCVRLIAPSVCQLSEKVRNALARAKWPWINTTSTVFSPPGHSIMRFKEKRTLS